MYLSNTPSCGRRGQVREQGATVQCRLRAEIPFKSLTNICSTLGETITIRHLRGNYTFEFQSLIFFPNLSLLSWSLFQQKKRENIGENFPEILSQKSSMFDVDHLWETRNDEQVRTSIYNASMYKRRCGDFAR